MAATMAVLAVAATGHVVGALTRVAGRAVPTVEQLAGDGVPVRSGADQIVVPTSDLTVATVPFAAGVLRNPAAKRVLLPSATEPDVEPAVKNVDPDSHGTVSAVAAATLTVSFVDAAAALQNAADDIPFVVVLQGPDGAASLTGQIDKGTSENAILHELDTGTYTALVLMNGCARHVQAVTVP